MVNLKDKVSPCTNPIYHTKRFFWAHAIMHILLQWDCFVGHCNTFDYSKHWSNIITTLLQYAFTKYGESLCFV